MHKDARGYAMRVLAALAVGCAAVLGGCGGDAERVTLVQPTAAASAAVAVATAVPPAATPVAPTAVPPTATSVAPTATAIPPTAAFASVAPEWLPTVLPDTPTPTAVPPTATPVPPTSTSAPPTATSPLSITVPTPSTATLTTGDPTRLAEPRFEHTALLLPSGNVILGGGHSGIVHIDHDIIALVQIPLTHFDVYHPAEGWSAINLVDDHRVFFRSSMVLMADGTIMVVRIGGGESGEDFTGAATLDPATQLWTPLPVPSITTRNLERNLETLRRIKGAIGTPLPAPISTMNGPLLALLQDGRVIAVSDRQFVKDGGNTYWFPPKSEIFDPRAGQWQTAASPNNMYISQGSTIVALQNGEALLIHSGNPSNSAYDEILAEIYDPDADEWRVALGMKARARPKAVVLPDGRALVVGAAIIEEGGRAWGKTTSAEIYDPATGAWTPTGDMVGSRLYFFALTLLPDGRVLVSGGKPLRGGILSTTEIYDPDTNAWTPGPDMAAARYDHTATTLPDGRILIAGGITDENAGAPPTNTSEIISVP